MLKVRLETNLYFLFSSSTDRYANVDVGVLLYHIERFTGIIVLTTNLIDNIDKAFFRRLKFVLSFDIPSYKLRQKIWKVHNYLYCHVQLFSSSCIPRMHTRHVVQFCTQ